MKSKYQSIMGSFMLDATTQLRGVVKTIGEHGHNRSVISISLNLLEHVGPDGTSPVIGVVTFKFSRLSTQATSSLHYLEGTLCR